MSSSSCPIIDLPRLEGTKHARFSSISEDGKNIDNIVVIDTRLASVAARGQLCEKQLESRKNEVLDVLTKNKVKEYLGNRHIDDSGVFEEFSGAWIMDTTHNLCDYDITMIAFETVYHKSSTSKVRVWVPVAYIVHKEMRFDAFSDAFHELNTLINDHCPELAVKRAACVITGFDPAFKDIFKMIPLFSGAAHAHCDFAFLKAAMNYPSAPLFCDDDDIACFDSYLRRLSNTLYATSIFGSHPSPPTSNKCFTYALGAVWGNEDHLRRHFRAKFDNGVFSMDDFMYLSDRNSYLRLMHGAYPRLMCGRVARFQTTTPIEGISLRLKSQQNHMRVSVYDAYIILHKHMTEVNRLLESNANRVDNEEEELKKRFMDLFIKKK